MPSIRRPALLISAALLGTAALGYEPALLRNLSVERPGARLSVSAARVPLWGAAFAQADQITLENVTLVLGSSTYTAKRMLFSGVTSSRAEIQTVFDRASSEPLADRLGRISARQVTIPELVAEQESGPLKQRTTYRNVVASDIARGRIASIAVDDGVMETLAPAKSTATHKRLTLTGLAAADLARIYVEKAGPQPAPLTRVYDRFSLEDIRLQQDDGSALRIAQVNGRDVLMRPTEESWSGSTSLITAMAEVDDPSAAETNRLAVTVADLLGAFEVGLVEMTGFDMQGKTDKGEPVAMRLARAAYTGAAGQPADMRLEGFDLAVKDGKVRFATLAFTGFSFQSTLAGIKALKGRSLDDLDVATIRTLIPTIGTVRFSGLDFDVADEKSKAPKPERVRFTAKDLEFTADRPVNGIPTNIRLGIQNVAMPLPADSKEEGIKELLDLGYKAVDFSLATQLTWDEAKQEIAIREVSASSAGMLNFKATGVIGNVTKYVFHADTALATVAALGATAKSLDVTVENLGLFERYLAQEAKKTRKTPEALRREYGAAASFAVPVLLGNSDQAKAIGQAVARFVAKPARLRLTARAKSAQGLGIADVMNVSEPVALLESLNVTAATDERL